MKLYLLNGIIMIISLSLSAQVNQSWGNHIQWSFEGNKGESFRKAGYLTWRQGVEGKAAFLDGYTSTIISEPIDSEKLSNGFTVSSWVALQTYPWNWTAIINQGTPSAQTPVKSDFVHDFFLGVNAYGYIGFKLQLKDTLIHLVSQEKLPLHSWQQITATYHSDKGIHLYVNANMVEHVDVTGELPKFENETLWIGRNLQDLGPIGSERSASFEIGSKMIIHGLLDEISLYAEALTQQQISSSYETQLPTNRQPLNYYALPIPSNDSVFRAYYTRLEYAQEWEHTWRVGDHPDIVVSFDQLPVKYVFWRGTGYGGVWVSESGIWMADQSLERAGKGKSPLGCSEHMSDKQTRYSQVKIIEKTDARIVLHWRYALSDILYNVYGAESTTDWGEWAEEYYYIYPDGVSTRFQKLWSDYLSHEWQETIVIHQPGQRPEDNIESDALTLANEAGEHMTYSWSNGVPKTFENPADVNVQLVNIKSRFKPFIIFENEVKIKPFTGGIRPSISRFPWWNHWPVAQLPNDGRQALDADRPSHSSLSQGMENSPVIHAHEDGTFSAVSLTGMTQHSIEWLVNLSRSWNHAPKVSSYSDNVDSVYYQKHQRAYVIQCALPKNKIEVRITASAKSPLIHPAFVITNWRSGNHVFDLKVNGDLLKRSEYRVGYEQGSDQLVIWMNKAFFEIVTIEFSSS